ncbi:Uncharacterised protein [Raoultella terrigena]|uniref:Uncharacterized protein n=1 Tax=Raoultella terrigena TaxID=577 RepID=A0A3P8KXI6_RAOTE|nr:Uncharacterised protein [Raoultella terrigena]
MQEQNTAVKNNKRAPIWPDPSCYNAIDLLHINNKNRSNAYVFYYIRVTG